MSVFTALPQDMLQWEINRFLDPLSRLHWNEVLKNDERVYSKFPKDYAIKHQIKLSHQTYQEIAWNLRLSLGCFDGEGPEGASSPSLDPQKSVKWLKRYFAWFKDPKNHIVLMHIEARKEWFFEGIRQWTEEDMELYETLSDAEVEALRDEALDTLNLVEDVPFLRNVPVKNYQNAFTI
jgi:hypothetical protein